MDKGLWVLIIFDIIYAYIYYRCTNKADMFSFGAILFEIGE